MATRSTPKAAPAAKKPAAKTPAKKPTTRKPAARRTAKEDKEDKVAEPRKPEPVLPKYGDKGARALPSKKTCEAFARGEGVPPLKLTREQQKKILEAEPPEVQKPAPLDDQGLPQKPKEAYVCNSSHDGMEHAPDCRCQKCTCDELEAGPPPPTRPSLGAAPRMRTHRIYDDPSFLADPWTPVQLACHAMIDTLAQMRTDTMIRRRPVDESDMQDLVKLQTKVDKLVSMLSTNVNSEFGDYHRQQDPAPSSYKSASKDPTLVLGVGTCPECRGSGYLGPEGMDENCRDCGATGYRDNCLHCGTPIGLDSKLKKRCVGCGRRL